LQYNHELLVSQKRVILTAKPLCGFHFPGFNIEDLKIPKILFLDPKHVLDNFGEIFSRQLPLELHLLALLVEDEGELGCIGFLKLSSSSSWPSSWHFTFSEFYLELK
jgi:hypothetical protein